MDARSTIGASERLREEFANRFPCDAIDEVFRDSTEELAKNARVDNFVPLLAERRARERLMALVRA